jgi:hypothetical protein
MEETMQYIVRYNLKPLKAEQYREWLKKNARVYKEGVPPGWKYLGTWFTVLGFGKYACEDRWEVKDYADLGSGFGSEELQKAFLESTEMIEQSTGETYLMKSAEEVIIMEGM